MRWLLFALLTGAVLQSQGQKFPKIGTNVPKLGTEVPKPVICPLLPGRLYAHERIDKVYKGLHSFLVEHIDPLIYQGISTGYLPVEIRQKCPGQVHIKANSLAEAICQAAWAWPATWYTRADSQHWFIVIATPKPGSKP